MRSLRSPTSGSLFQPLSPSPGSCTGSGNSEAPCCLPALAHPRQALTLIQALRSSVQPSSMLDSKAASQNPGYPSRCCFVLPLFAYVIFCNATCFKKKKKSLFLWPLKETLTQSRHFGGLQSAAYTAWGTL